MVLFNTIRDNDKIQNIVFASGLCMALAYLILPNMLLVMLFPFLWISIVIPWVIFCGIEVYNATQVLVDSDSTIGKYLFFGNGKPSEYFLQIKESGSAIKRIYLPILLYVLLTLSMFSYILGFIISVAIGVLLYLWHKYHINCAYVSAMD